MSNRIILWLDDKDESDIHSQLQKCCNSHDLDLIKVDDLSLFAEKLLSVKKENRIISGFIMDLLLAGTNDLSDFGIDYQWNHLQEDGGLILIQKVLQSGQFNYQDIPILVLSVRANKIQELEGAQELTVVQKRNHLNRNWENKITQWIKFCAKNKCVIDNE